MNKTQQRMLRKGIRHIKEMEKVFNTVEGVEMPSHRRQFLREKRWLFEQHKQLLFELWLTEHMKDCNVRQLNLKV